MNRLTADLLLALAGLVWGFGFVAQKTAADAQLGPFTFVASRFLISALLVLPFVQREGGLPRFFKSLRKSDRFRILGLCLSCSGAVIFQQCGLVSTTVTNAAFLTGIYIVLVPFAARLLYQQKLTAIAVLASLLSFAGVWLLSGGDALHPLPGLNGGDLLVLLCALCYAVQVPMLGHIVGGLKAPFTLSFLQFAVTGFVALVLAVFGEHPHVETIVASWQSILYAGIAAGGIAYTLQAVAQQHTPPADAAIIMSSESLFGAIGGAWLMHDRLTLSGYIGCAAILLAVVAVELTPHVKKRARKKKA